MKAIIKGVEIDTYEKNILKVIIRKVSNMEDKNQKPTSTRINWDSGTNRKLSVTVDIIDFQKIHFVYLIKNRKENKA